MKNIFRNIILLLPILFLFSSCELEDRRYKGPLFIEFAPEVYGQIASSSGIAKEASVGQDKIGVQLIGLAQQEQITVNFRLADQVFYMISLDRYYSELPEGSKPSEYNTIQATAQYNVDYSFDGISSVTFDKKYNRGSFTIDAGSQFGTIPIEILSKGGAKLFFVLEDSDDIRANVPTALLRVETPVDKIILLDESFATDPFDRGWYDIDRDGDGYSWEWYNNPASITSDSYRSSTALNPENYLVSPLVEIPSNAKNVSLEFQIAAGASGSDHKEQYAVLISEDPITFDNCRNAKVIQDYTVLTEANAGKKFTNVSIDISEYAGKSVYVAVLHGNCSDQYYILLRNFSIYTH